jgi:hypothetical protein
MMETSVLVQIQEFLTCLQVPRDRMLDWADAIYKATAFTGELTFVASKALRRSVVQGNGRRLRRRGTRVYALRDVRAPFDPWTPPLRQGEPGRSGSDET